MIDHILGRPSPSWKRKQVLAVIMFWTGILFLGDRKGPRILWIRRVNRALQMFTPWQMIAGVLTLVYSFRHLDNLLALESPEPLARLYVPSYYRATWIVTGLDAGFATALAFRTKWLRDILSIAFSAYYILNVRAADEKLRRYRAVCTVEMLRATWEKTSNRYIRALTCFCRPRLSTIQQVSLPRPSGSSHSEPIQASLYFDGNASQLAECLELILDLPGGGFVSMGPIHHEERLLRWAKRTHRPVLSIDYRKAPEYPFPYAIEEVFDAYRTLVSSRGQIIGMSGRKLSVILTGDSAGANLVANTIFKILESPIPIPLPKALVMAYAALDFNISSWMSPQHLSVLEREASRVSTRLQSGSRLSSFAEQKDHLSHRSPLSTIDDRFRGRPRKNSWTPLHTLPGLTMTDNRSSQGGQEDRPLSTRVVYTEPGEKSPEEVRSADAKTTLGTRLTMSSRMGYVQDRIITPNMMRAMAILYVGPHRNPDFELDYRLSPIRAPDALLARFPPLLMTCGERDPFVDDTIVFAGRIREAKRSRRAELKHTLQGTVGEQLQSELDSLSEKEMDWLELQIIEGFSHGYLQMASLIPEAGAIIDGIGDWIANCFAMSRRKSKDLNTSTAPSVSGNKRAVKFRIVEDSTGISNDDPKRTTSGQSAGDVVSAIAPRKSRTNSSSRARDESDKTLVESGTGSALLSEEELIRRRRQLDSHVFEEK